MAFSYLNDLHTNGINQSKSQKDDYDFPFQVPLITIHKHLLFQENNDNKKNVHEPFSSLLTKNGNSLIQEKMKSLFKKPFIFSLKPFDVFKIPLEIRHKQKSVNINVYTLWRRERDSNPRYLAVQRFSRPPQSTTLPSLQTLL